MTWKEVKVATLQKMFAAEGNDIPNDDSVTDYIASMPQAANEALLLLSTANKFIIKSYTVAHNPVENIIPDSLAKRINQTLGGTIEFSADGAKSYYFTCVGTGTCTISIDGTVLSTITLDSASAYKEYRGLITNENGSKVVLTFTSSYPLAVNNIAMYTATFPTDADVQSFKEIYTYDMKTLCSDFYKLADQQIYFEGDSDTHRYIQTSEYFLESGNTLVLPRDEKGNYTVYYKAYPATITTSTADDYELPLDPEVSVLLPQYMASELYKDDDNGIATTYRNEFEVGRDALSNSANAPTAESFVSESGWV